MKKKSFTFVELIVVIFVISFVGIFVYTAVQNFFSTSQKQLLIKQHSTSYNKLISFLYKKNYNWWIFFSSTNSWLILYNSWFFLDTTWYIWYSCQESWFNITNISTWNIDWDSSSNYFTWIICYNLTGWQVTWGYWIWFNMVIRKNIIPVKYFFYSKNK